MSNPMKVVTYSDFKKTIKRWIWKRKFYILWCALVLPFVVVFVFYYRITNNGDRMKAALIYKTEHDEHIEKTVLGMAPNRPDWWCEALFEDKDQQAFPEAYEAILPEFTERIQQIKEKMEGHTAQKWRQALAYSRLANNSFVMNICETGFNAGHSALTWLTSNSQAHVYFFDLSLHQFSKDMAKFFQKRFPGRTTFTWGDSRKTIPQFSKKNPTVMCDLIHIDGGHSYNVAKADLRNMRSHARKDGHLLLLDDHPSVRNPGVGIAWKEQLRLGQVQEYWGCQFEFQLDKGFTVAKFTDLDQTYSLCTMIAC